MGALFIGEKMKFNLEDLNPPTRFLFKDDDEGEGWVELRSLPIKKTREIDKKTIFNRKKIKRGQLIEEQEIKHDLRDKLMWDYVIHSWLIYDNNGKEIPCTVENKLKLMNESTFFATFIADGLSEITGNDSELEEQEEKN